MIRAVDIIRKKRDGQELADREIAWMVEGKVRGEVADYQWTALLMAIFWRGMSKAEIAALTDAMVRSGTVVDLSASNDFEKGHIAGSRSVQPSQFDPQNKLLANAKALPVVVVCRTGQASAEAARKLKQAGFEKVYWLDGGIQAWQQADLPLVKGSV